MVRTNAVDGNCPVCGNGMVISRLSCRNCGSALEGSFSLREPTSGFETHLCHRDAPGDELLLGRLARMDGTQLEFVEIFLRCRGIIKNVENMLGISYPTVKTRLAHVRATMGFGPEEDMKGDTL